MLTFRLVSLVLFAAILLQFSGWSESKLRPRRGQHTFGLNRDKISYNYGSKNWNGGINYQPHNGDWGASLGFTFKKKRNQIFGQPLNSDKTAANTLLEIINGLTVIKSEFSNTALKNLALPLHDRPITNKMLIRDIYCLGRQILQVVPNLRNFVENQMRMYDLRSDVAVYGCKSLEGQASVNLTGTDLLQIKKFIVALVTTLSELQKKE